jgi:starvation-inducible DNA-binding protein
MHGSCKEIAAHLAALVDRHAKMASSAHRTIDATQETGDADTGDLFTAFFRTLDKQLWFLEAHLQERD